MDGISAITLTPLNGSGFPASIDQRYGALKSTTLGQRGVEREERKLRCKKKQPGSVYCT